MKIFGQLRSSLKRTHDLLVGKIESFFSTREVDEASLDDLEEILLSADIGVSVTETLLSSLREGIRSGVIRGPQDLKLFLKDKILSLLNKANKRISHDGHQGLLVILVLGVNGTGKTTTIAKIAHRFKQEGKGVLLAAGDTYRAAAIDQLKIWADRVGVDLIHHQPGGDPSAVVFDAIKAGMARGKDVLIIDTAGRLHNNRGLMEELKKMKRTIQRQLEGAPQEVLLVLDATTGANALQQAILFHEAVGLTGLVIAKLDGTAKGGMVLAIADKLGIPVQYMGLGEGLEDLQEFDSQAFVEALFQES